MNEQLKKTPRRILVLASEAVGGRAVLDAIASRGTGPAEVLVVAPALNGRVRHWISDEDEDRRAAARRLRACLAGLRADGVHAEGLVGDADPLLAIADALCLFPADEIVVVTRPEGRSNRLARNLPARTRKRFALPIDHVVVDLEREREHLAAA